MTTTHAGGQQAYREPAGEEQLVREVDRRLRIYGNDRHSNKENPFDELIFIILSAQTEAYSYRETYNALSGRFPRWEGLSDVSEEELASVIRNGGLSRKKARQIKGAVAEVIARAGTLSLDFLTNMDTPSAEKYLATLPGIGIKSAKCILMYCFGRPVFPVDTHVWRVCRRLGLAPGVPKPTPVMERALEAKIPPELRYSLHVNMVSHGQQRCATYWPKCDSCPLNDVCPSAFHQDIVWGQWRRPRGAWSRAVAEQPTGVVDYVRKIRRQPPPANAPTTEDERTS